jgi:hypothetical protein
MAIGVRFMIFLLNCCCSNGLRLHCTSLELLISTRQKLKKDGYRTVSRRVCPLMEGGGGATIRTVRRSHSFFWCSRDCRLRVNIYLNIESMDRQQLGSEIRQHGWPELYPNTYNRTRREANRWYKFENVGVICGSNYSWLHKVEFDNKRTQAGIWVAGDFELRGVR